MKHRPWGHALLALAGVALAGSSCRSGANDARRDSPGVHAAALGLDRSTSPPGGLTPAQVPQFVAVTFDDNFTPEGMDWATGFLRPLVNNGGSNNPGTFDGTPVRTTFPSNSLYLSGMQASWQTAVNDGHEFDNHTVNHGDGINFTVDQWNPEIANCTSALVGGLGSAGHPLDITGFRAPFLHYNDALYTALSNNHLVYDSSIMGCWQDTQNAQSCAWPYTLDHGSADADAIFAKWSDRSVQPVSTAHPGLWELPVVTLFVPDDSLASQYGFPPGLRTRLQNRLGGAQNPNFFEASTGRLVGLDITLYLDGQMSKAEALATLKYTLDQHLAGNRAPFILVAHTHVYASNWDGNAPNISNTADRRAVISEFVNYALSKQPVRIRPLRDVLAWMKQPVPLGTCTPTTCAAQGKSCGSIGDGCGGTLACGTCSGGLSCIDNVCRACTPTTCAAQGKSCGSISDGCGGTLACGTCPSGQVCSSSQVCQSQSCTPTVSSYQQGRCNATALFNGKLYKCLSQAAGVNGEPTGCGTSGVYCSAITPDDAAWGTTAWQLVAGCN